MSTRSRIGYVVSGNLDDNTALIKSIYCHYDGYPSWNGKVLLENYNTEQKAIDLISMGDISVLGPEIGEKHPFDYHDHPDTKKFNKWCTAYGRDRGDDNVDAIEFDQSKSNMSFPQWADEYSNAEFVYVWYNGKWFFAPTGNYDLKELTIKDCED